MLTDARLVLRSLRQAPGFTIAATLTVALSVGANTAIFSIADAVLFRPLPYVDPDRLFVLESANPTGQRGALVRWAHLRAIREGHAGLSDVGTLEFGPTVVAAGADGPEAVRTAAVSANYFEILAVRPARGRLFTPADAGNPRVAVLSYEAWRSRFGGEERIVGQSVAFGATNYDIVGVLPPGAAFPSPLARRPELIVLHDTWDGGPNTGALAPIVRLESGTTREQADAELSALGRAINAADPSIRSVPVLQDLRAVLFPVGRPIARFLLASALLVLLIGCANLANMFLVRARWRERDVSVRTALGASSAHLMRPILLEAALIGIAGAALAVVVTRLSFETLVRQVPAIAYGAAPVGVDLRVTIFALALGGLCGILFAGAAAYRTSRLDPVAVMQRRGAGSPVLSHGFGRPLVVAQVTLTLTLVFGASLAAQALISVLRAPLAFDPEHVATLRVFPVTASGAERETVYQTLVDRMATHPEVAAAGAAASLPLDGAAVFDAIRGDDGRPVAGIDHALPGYFEAIGARLQAGRFFTDADLRGARDVAVVSETLARTHFPGRDPIGAVFRGRTGKPYRVIGVIADLRAALDPAPMPVAYVFPGEDTRGMVVAVRLRARNDAVLAELRWMVNATVPGQPVTAVWWSNSLGALTVFRNPRFQALVLGGFALLGLVLTATGIAAVVGALVAGRSHEMGVRLAVGASPGALVALLVRHAMMPVLIGTLAGLAATRGLARLAEAQLYRVNTDDPRLLTIAAIVVLLTALAAAGLTARRARRVDPMVMLRANG